MRVINVVEVFDWPLPRSCRYAEVHRMSLSAKALKELQQISSQIRQLLLFQWSDCAPRFSSLEPLLWGHSVGLTPEKLRVDRVMFAIGRGCWC
jgi:hypothetical protein